MPKYFVAGYWIVDWKGIANYSLVFAIVINSKCWIWFSGVEDSYPARKKGFNVGKIIFGSENPEELQRLKDRLKDRINIRDWHTPSQEEIVSVTQDEDSIKMGQIQPEALLSKSSYERIMDGLRRAAQRNEDLAQRLSQSSN
jgi:hypothetical protein